jgi:hypothetical protein
MRQFRSGRKLVTARAGLAAVLAAVGIPGLSPSVALANSPSVLTWTEQPPVTGPSARVAAAMAYDAATRTDVLFGGGDNSDGLPNDTWTWDGTAWTKQAPATHPPGRYSASMAYDAATGTDVLFGGQSSTHRRLKDTWTWSGAAWTRQAPATIPPRRMEAPMAYDAASRDVVLFGGFGEVSGLGDTWTWG